MAKRSRIWLIALAATVLTTANVAFATEFAVLRQRFDHNPTATDIAVPSSGSTGGIIPNTMAINLPDDDLPLDGSSELLTIDFNPTLPTGTPQLPGNPFIFGLTLSDPNTGALTTQFSDPVTVGFSDQTFANNITYNQLCLAYLDVSGPTPQWTIQASPLALSNSYLCGNTDHFSIFALAETDSVPEPASLGVIAIALAGLSVRRTARGIK